MTPLPRPPTRPGVRGPARVLIVDDSSMICALLSHGLGEDRDIEVIGTANDPYEARDAIVRLSPDVVTLDLEMPRMNGLDFLTRLMAQKPMPVIIVSSMSQRGTETAAAALAAGAVEVIGKPNTGLTSVDAWMNELRAKVKRAARARVQTLAPSAGAAIRETVQRGRASGTAEAPRLIAIGASTGGPQALTCVLGGLSAASPGTVVVQHMPATFTAALAKRLDACCPMTVVELRGHAEVRPGRVLLAPGDQHLEVRRTGDRLYAHCVDKPPVNGHRPSVDVLMHSVARAAGARSIGVMLTGMGNDGAAGLLAMRRAGAHTVAQDEASCVVYGMPRAAVALGAAEKVAPLTGVAAVVGEWVLGR